MKFSILHSSARPDKWEEVYAQWIAAADQPVQVEYILVADRRWGFDRLPEFRWNQDGRHKALWNTGRRCYVDGVNIAAAYAQGDILIVNADDQFPCAHWDSELLKVILDPRYSEDACLRSNFVVEVTTNTPAEHDRGIMVMPILSRVRYQKQGHVFYPAYESMYADNDFCAKAHADNCNPEYCGDDRGIVLDARHLVFPHKHPIFDQSRAWDAAYEQQNRREAYELGAAIFEKRKESNFADIRVIVKEKPKRSIACLLPGEHFSQAWVGAWTDIVSVLNDSWTVHVQFGHASNVYFARQAMADAIRPVNADLLLWIDDDQILTLEGLNHLIADLDADPELDGVVGWAWCQPDSYDNGPMLSCGAWDQDGNPQRFTYECLMDGPEDVKPISYSGFPVVLMRGRTLEKAGARAFLPIFDEKSFPPYGMSGEDAAFFFRARQKGCKFAVDRRVKVPHLKLRCAEPVTSASLEAAPARAERERREVAL